jgi:tRNA(Ile)-lysidine synthase
LDRAAVLRYLEDRNLSYRTDSTNRDNRFLRNRVRNRLIPLLDELFPSWEKSLSALGETQGLAAAFITASARSGLPWESVGPHALVLPREDFFAEPEIVREEALFLAADRLKGALRDAGGGGLNPDRPRRAGEPRRESIRLFAQGGISALDAGPLRLEDRGDRVFVLPRRDSFYEAGFLRLIKEPGRYKLRGFIIETGEPGGGKKGFFARLPLVLRQNFHDDCIIVKGRKRSVKKVLERMPPSEYTGIINAGDKDGTAAVIGVDRNGPVILLRREETTGEPGLFFSLAGGTDV